MSAEDSTGESPRKRARLSPSTDVAPETTSAPPVTKPATVDEKLADPIELVEQPNLTEADKEANAGITEYVSPENSGFNGILKQRYTDFLVNEILPNRKVLHLESIGLKEESAPEQKKSELKKEEQEEEVNGANAPAAPAAAPEAQLPEVKTEKPAEEQNGKEASVGSAELSEANKATLIKIFGERVTTELQSLVRAVQKHPDRKANQFQPVITEPISDKWERTTAHETLRQVFPEKLESNTGDNDTITIKPLPPRQKRKRGDNSGGRSREHTEMRGKLSWNMLGGEYLHFTLYKENKDTMEVVGFLASRMKTQPRSFGFGGTKDRRGVTVQRVSVKRVLAQDMARVGRQLRGSFLGDYKHENYPLELGDCAGNEFAISLRDCHFPDEEGLNAAQRIELGRRVIEKAVKDFSEKGFINYYGLQRFGSFAASTDGIGLKLLQDNLADAISDILSYSPVALAGYEADNQKGGSTSTSSPSDKPTLLIGRDDKARAKALHIWKTTKNADAALRIMPRKFQAETQIIRYLGLKTRKTGSLDRIKDYQGALSQIPRNLRLMYVHAYQSFVWNTVAGKRWTLYGNKVVEGDLVLVHEHKDKEQGAEKQKNTEDQYDQDGELIQPAPLLPDAVPVSSTYERARALTAEEAASGKYNVYDIVLPLPGYDVEYPKNAVGEFYKEFMGSDKGGRLDPHDMRRKWKDLSLSGSYRKVLAKPLREVEWELRPYVKNEEQFVDTDVQRILGRKEDKIKVASEDVEMGVAGEEEKETTTEKIAVVLKLQLGTSTYATMALRELMKPGGVKPYKPDYMGGR